jgi:putative transposase
MRRIRHPEIIASMRGAKEGKDFAQLTETLQCGTFEMSTKEHRQVKHITAKQNLRDSMTSLELAPVRQFEAIYHEDLQTANLLKNHQLAKSIQDAGWSAFLSLPAAKAAYAGRRVIAVPPAYSSQTCSGCGAVVNKGLSDRWHRSTDCGTSLHRDQNAAKNIERLGQSLQGEVA